MNGPVYLPAPSWNCLPGAYFAARLRWIPKLQAVAGLLNKYRDQEMQLADACLVRMSEVHREAKVFTLDVTDFTRYRRFDRRVISLVSP